MAQTLGVFMKPPRRDPEEGTKPPSRPDFELKAIEAKCVVGSIAVHGLPDNGSGQADRFPQAGER